MDFHSKITPDLQLIKQLIKHGMLVILCILLCGAISRDMLVYMLTGSIHLVAPGYEYTNSLVAARISTYIDVFFSRMEESTTLAQSVKVKQEISIILMFSCVDIYSFV